MAWRDIVSGIISSIYSDILSDIFSGKWSGPGAAHSIWEEDTLTIPHLAGLAGDGKNKPS